MTPAVWLVVLNWHGRADTLALLADLDVALPAGATVLVVDNGSFDGTLDEAAHCGPSVRTLQTGANLGFAGGMNAGINHALAYGADLVGVLNNDTSVPPGFLAPLLDVLATREPCAVSPDIRYATDPGTSWFGGGVLDRRAGRPVHRTAGAGSSGTDFLTGCCLLASAATWRRVGLFDERLFLIFEDADWSVRARALGVELLVVPGSRITHRVSRSFTGTVHALGGYYFARNGAIFAVRHLGLRPLARFVRHEVLRPAPGRVRTAAGRAALSMQLLGLAAAVLGVRGPAGSLATAAARRCAATPAGGAR